MLKGYTFSKGTEKNLDCITILLSKKGGGDRVGRKVERQTGRQEGRKKKEGRQTDLSAKADNKKICLGKSKQFFLKYTPPI